MSLQRVVNSRGKPGYRWGDNGRIFTYIVGDGKSRNAAKRRALAQGKSIKASKKKRKGAR